MNRKKIQKKNEHRISTQTRVDLLTSHLNTNFYNFHAAICLFSRVHLIASPDTLIGQQFAIEFGHPEGKKASACYKESLRPPLLFAKAIVRTVMPQNLIATFHFLDFQL